MAKAAAKAGSAKEPAKNKVMSKLALTRELSQRLDVPQTKAAEFIETYSEILQREVRDNGIFNLPEIGRIKRVERPAREVRDIKTGEKRMAPASKKLRFAPARTFKEEILKS